MPELPEVECLTRALRTKIVGRTITAAEITWNRTLAEPSRSSFLQRIRGSRISSIERRGKYASIRLESERQGALSLIFHLRMSGRIRIIGAAPAERHERLRLFLDNGSILSFVDPRKFGRVWLMKNEATLFQRLGPEPLSPAFSPELLKEILSSKKGSLKPLLLDQSRIAGLGNIYVDESLWRARLHPLSRACGLSAVQTRLLHSCIRATLNRAIRHQGTDNGDGVIEAGLYRPRVYGRAGLPCYRCGTAVRRIVVGQRGTHYCPKCQRR